MELAFFISLGLIIPEMRWKQHPACIEGKK
jgi:hypothetical protein